MKNLTELCEGILSTIDSDVEADVKEQEIYTYLKSPHMFEWGDFFNTVSAWVEKFGKIGGLYRDKKLCGTQPVAYIYQYVDKVSDDTFKLGIKRGDRLIVLFLTEEGGALIYTKDKRGKTQVKKIPAWSSMTIMGQVTGGKMYANIADLPFYDVYYIALTKDVDEYNIPKLEVKKILNHCS